MKRSCTAGLMSLLQAAPQRTNQDGKMTTSKDSAAQKKLACTFQRQWAKTS